MLTVRFKTNAIMRSIIRTLQHLTHELNIANDARNHLFRHEHKPDKTILAAADKYETTYQYQWKRAINKTEEDIDSKESIRKDLVKQLAEKILRKLNLPITTYNMHTAEAIARECFLTDDACAYKADEKVIEVKWSKDHIEGQQKHFEVEHTAGIWEVEKAAIECAV